MWKKMQERGPGNQQQTWRDVVVDRLVSNVLGTLCTATAASLVVVG